MKQDEKEDFCPPCLAAIPLAFAATGKGASNVVDDSTEEGKKNKTILQTVSYWSLIIFVSFVVTYIIWFICKILFIKIFKCESCK